MTTDLRCPQHNGLLGRLTALQRDLIVLTEVELACDQCKRTERKQTPGLVRVLHRFNVSSGQFLETEVIK